MGRAAVGYLAESMHGAGSPQAQRIMIHRLSDLDEKKKSLSATVFGEKLDMSKHKIGSEIKAVTYHLLEVKKSKPFYVQVLFDI